MKLIKLSILFLGLLSICSCANRYAKVASYDLAEVKSRPIFDKTGYTKVSDRENRKMLFYADLNLRVEHPDTANVRLAKLAETYEGYVQELGTTRTIIRVKSDQLESAIAAIGTIGKILNKEIRGTDVTATYQDANIRLENAEKTRKRYLELLDQAQTVEEILQVEKELERLNTEIDLLKGQINRLDHLDTFSTINIQLKERKKPGVLGYVGLGLYHSVKWLFVRN